VFEIIGWFTIVDPTYERTEMSTRETERAVYAELAAVTST